jgi:DNA-binding LacI/PurR family transcriptional regulator
MPKLTRTTPFSKKEEIYRELTTRLEKGVYTPGNFLPPERLLAEEFGVSRPTLRKALEPLVTAGLLAHHPGIGTRVAIPGQNENALGKSRQAIGLLLPDITNRFYSELTESIEYGALQRGYHLILCNSRHQLSLEDLHIRELANRPVSGVILAHDPHLRTPAAVSLLDAAGIPYVVLFSSPAEVACDSVVVDDRSGVDQLMRYLLSLGHRHVAFCRSVPGKEPHPREREYLRFMAQNKLPVAPHFVVPHDSLADTACRSTLEHLFQQVPRPTALFGCNDHVALIVMKHLFGMGIKVPREVSVVGFDNLRFTEHLPVPLTTVDQPKQEMGRRAIELLLERIEIGKDRAPRSEVFHPHLIIRDSCAMVYTPENLEVATVL